MPADATDRDIEQLRARLRLADAADRRMYLLELAQALSKRYARTAGDGAAKQPDLDEAIDLLREANDTFAPNDPLRAAIHNALGRLYAARHMHHGSAATDRDRAIEHFEAGLDAPGLDRGMEELALVTSAVLLLKRCLPQSLPTGGPTADFTEFARAMTALRAAASTGITDVDTAIERLRLVADRGAQYERIAQLLPMLLSHAILLRSMLGIYADTGGGMDAFLRMAADVADMGGRVPGGGFGVPGGGFGFPGGGFPGGGFPGGGFPGGDLGSLLLAATPDGPLDALRAAVARRPELLARRPERVALPGGDAEPSTVDIAAALRAGGRDALVYLVPPRDGRPPHLLAVTASGHVAEIAVDAAPEGPLSGYAEALRAWAWPAGMGPLVRYLRESAAGEAPAVTLVPVGEYALVPWHAAHDPAGAGEARPACADLVVSYAASARELVDATVREALPLGADPVFVANPAGDRPEETFLAMALRRVYYPRSTGYGQVGEAASGAGTPEEIAAHLPDGDRPGASLLHLGGSGPPPVPRGRAATSAGTTSGGLVVLAAEADAATFLRTGAVGVVCPQWPVPGRLSAPLLFMFHHFLAGGSRPARALRAAQLWALDPDREVPDEMPSVFRPALSDPALADAATWAAFTHRGQ